MVPFMSQIPRWPVTVFCQRMSALPSPLKSPEPAMLHDVPTVPKSTKDRNVMPFMGQIRAGQWSCFAKECPPCSPR